MPKGEKEEHPYLQQGCITDATRLILGSFPVYECTDPDNEIKQRNRLKECSIRFFYGSVDSRFWQLYRCHVDGSITVPPNIELVLSSLRHKQIAISDTIISCERNEYSSADSDLINRRYNTEGVQRLLSNGVRKVLCTSKGVLADLEKRMILHGRPSFGVVDIDSSRGFQNDYLSSIGGAVDNIGNPVAKIFKVDDYEIRALAIPSPGSPQRKLAQYGFVSGDRRAYIQAYYSQAFAWLCQ